MGLYRDICEISVEISGIFSVWRGTRKEPHANTKKTAKSLPQLSFTYE